MKKIGMIVAIEMDAILKKYGQPNQKETHGGFNVLTYSFPTYTLIVLNCGVGEIAAAAGTQALISKYDVELILNFGIVGGLTDEMTLTKCCIVDRVVHTDFDGGEFGNVGPARYMDYPSIFIPTTHSFVEKIQSEHPEIKVVTCASADKFISDPKRKAELHELYQADICEMEAAGVVLTCNRNNIPCILIKAISDSLNGGEEEFFTAWEHVAQSSFEIVDKLIQTI